MPSRAARVALVGFVVLPVLAFSVWLLGATRQGGSSSPTIADNENANAPVFDEQGRYIVFVGETELRIPDEALDWTHSPVNPYDIFLLVFCWPDAETYNYCAENTSQVRVHLQATRPSNLFPFNDGESVVARNTEAYGEPIETANPLVRKYEATPGSDASVYTINQLRRSGRFPLARCDGFRCKVSFTPRAGLRVTYEFWQTHIDDWQGIDQLITSRVDDFILER